jgi:DNA-binding GntR family transcriptional regulator
MLSGELREGRQLREDAIAAEFQISRIPVREALSHLAAEGPITLVANRGDRGFRALSGRNYGVV